MKYSEILKQAKNIKNNAEKKQKKPNGKWSYYFAKSILKPETDIPNFKFEEAIKSTGDHFSRQIKKSEYLDMAKRLIRYVEKNERLPNYITVAGKNMMVSDYTYMFSRILVYLDKHEILPKYANVNSKVWIKPTETTNEVYNYFIDVFGSFGDTIDGALNKIASKGYGYYYDDVYSNREAINRMKTGRGVNCTDSCQVFYNIVLALINKGKYRKVEGLHIKCRGGDGHIRLRITLKDGGVIYRDPASVLNGDGVASNWCMNGTLLAVNPSWFMSNLNR